MKRAVSAGHRSRSKHSRMEQGVEESTRLSMADVRDISMRLLTVAGLSRLHAEAVSDLIVAGQRDECHSHGLYRLIGCVHTIRNGKLNPDAEPEIADGAPGIVKVDARYGYSALAFRMGLPLLKKKAQTVGLGALAINNCFHFSALWPEVEQLAEDGLAAIAMTPSHSWVAPHGGVKPLFGTNPIAFAWPRPGKNPFVFDFATSATARGEIELHRRADKPIAEGLAIDETGVPTTDPAKALKGAMLTFGGHKGSALSTMVELLASALIGDMTRPGVGCVRRRRRCHAVPWRADTRLRSETLHG
jgi:delta1-piperideine-2-carboxylate reductase